MFRLLGFNQRSRKMKLFKIWNGKNYDIIFDFPNDELYNVFDAYYSEVYFR